MNHWTLLAILLGLSLAPAAPAKADSSALPADLTNEAIYQYMVANDYPDWALLPGTTAFHYDPPNSHDTFLTVRVNAIAEKYLTANYPFNFKPYEDATGSNFLNLPAGSLIYKVSYEQRNGPPSGGPVVMYKLPAEQLASCGYPECQNGWLFAYIDVDIGSNGPPKNPGRYSDDPTCVACHTGAYSADASSQKFYNQSAKYMLSEADYVWSVFYQQVQKLD